MIVNYVSHKKMFFFVKCLDMKYHNFAIIFGKTVRRFPLY